MRYKICPNKNQRHRFDFERCSVWSVVKTLDCVKCDEAIFLKLFWWVAKTGHPRNLSNFRQDKVLNYIDFMEPSGEMEESAFENLKRYIDECRFPTYKNYANS